MPKNKRLVRQPRKLNFSTPPPLAKNQQLLPYQYRKRALVSSKDNDNEKPIAGPSPKKKVRPTNEANSSTTSNGHASDSDSQETVDSDFAKDAIQQMSIHRILIPNQGIINTANSINDLQKEENLIDRIIIEYNQQQKSEKKNSEDVFRFEEQQCEPIFVVRKEEEKSFMVGDGFLNRVYVQETRATSNLLRLYKLGSKFQTRNIHIVSFLYRKDEIFALTTNQAWNVVHNHSDFDFPGKIAARLCSEEGAKLTQDKVLIGNLLQNTKLMKDGQSPSTNDVPVLCTSFTADLRGNASILKLPCFEKERAKKARALILFGFGYLRIKKQLTASDVPLILDHLSIIAQGLRTEKYVAPSRSSSGCTGVNETNNNGAREEEEQVHADIITEGSTNSSDSEDQDGFVFTRDSGLGMSRPTLMSYDQNGTDNSGSDDSDDSGSNSASVQFVATPRASHPNLSQYSQDSLFDSSQLEDELSEKDTEVYQRNLTRLPKELSVELDEALAKIFNEVIKGRQQPSELNSFELAYRYTKDFALATSLSLICKNSKILLPVHSTLQDIINAVMRSDHDDVKALRDVDDTDYKKLNAAMKNFKIQYRLPEGKYESDNLFNFMDGELVHKGHIYWRVMRQWCKVNKYYLMNTHYWFQNFLQKNLIPNQLQNEKGNGISALPIKWPSKGKCKQLLEDDPNMNLIKYYTSLFTNQTGFYEPLIHDKLNGYGLFDLLHLDRENEKIVIYFFSNDFTRHTSKVCERIFRCRQEIQKALNVRSTGQFKKFFVQHFGEKTAGYVSSRYDDFKSKLRTCTIVYALPSVEITEIDREGPMDAFIQSSPENQVVGLSKRSLLDEAAVVFQVTLKEIQKCLNNASSSFTKEDMLLLLPDGSTELDDSALKTATMKIIFQDLLDSKYIAKLGQLDNMVTENFVYATERTFNLKSIARSRTISREEKEKNLKLRKKLFHQVLSKFRPKYTSLRAKLELREVANNRKTKFKMYEVEVEED